ADFDHLGAFEPASEGAMNRFYGSLRWDVPLGDHLTLQVEAGGAQANQRFIAFQGGARFDPATNLFGYIEADHRGKHSETTFSFSFNRISATIRSLDDRLLGDAILLNPSDVNPAFPRTPILVNPDFAGDGLVSTGGKGPDVFPNPAFGQPISASLDVFAAEAWTTRHLGGHDVTAGASL